MRALVRHPLALTVALVALGVVAIGVLATQAMPSSDSVDTRCAPAPCLAPHGFEAYFVDAHVADSHVVLEVRLTNHTSAGQFEAVSYRHTSPADFRLAWPDGSEHDAVFTVDCPNWPELQVERGASSGPKPLCFNAPSTGVRGTRIVWDPDLGLFSAPIATPLG